MSDLRVNGDEQSKDAQQGTDPKSAVRMDDLVSSLSEEEMKDLATRIAREISQPEAKKSIVTEAVKSAPAAAQNAVAAEAVRVAPLEAKKAAAAEAVNSASAENKVNVATEGVEQLSPKQQRELVDRLPITPVTADEIWRTVVGAFKWVLWGATLALVAAIGVALFREVDQALVQILLTVFTTVAGIFAGFIGGKALGTSTGE